MAWAMAATHARAEPSPEPTPTGALPAAASRPAETLKRRGPDGPKPMPPASTDPSPVSPIVPEEGTFWDDWSLLPLIFYTPETSVGFGLAIVHSFDLDKDRAPLSTIGAGVIVTVKEQILARIEPDLQLRGASIHANLRFQRFPTRFFAPGGHLGDKGEGYDERMALGSVFAHATVAGPLAIGGGCEFRWNDMLEVKPDGLLAGTRDMGLATYTSLGCGPTVTYDTRDDLRLPHKGLLAELKALVLGGLGGAEFFGVQMSLDLRAFAHLGKDHILAAQLRLESTVGDMPFQLLPKLGGPNVMRGWYEGHLRGNHSLLAQLEWRFPLFWKLGFVVFGGIGETAHRIDEFDAEHLRFSVGGGVRLLLNKKQSVVVRLDAAYGSGFAAYLDVLEAF